MTYGDVDREATHDWLDQRRSEAYTDEYDPRDDPDDPAYQRARAAYDDDQCAGEGHPYYGDDGEVGADGQDALGRCFCGHVTYPTGGPVPPPRVALTGYPSPDDEPF
jgi:hypothetical protein